MKNKILKFRKMNVKEQAGYNFYTILFFGYFLSGFMSFFLFSIFNDFILKLLSLIGGIWLIIRGFKEGINAYKISGEFEFLDMGKTWMLKINKRR